MKRYRHGDPEPSGFIVFVIPLGLMLAAIIILKVFVNV